MITRRQFLAASGASMLINSMLTKSSNAKSFSHPIGVQLWSVKAELEKDFEGTLRSVAALGYREVEFAGYFNHQPTDLLKILKSCGLKGVSTHCSGVDLLAKGDEMIDIAAKLGVKYFICSSPAFRAGDGSKDLTWDEKMHALTLDDWKMNADLFNKAAEKVHKAGMQFGYHNHVIEFRRFGDVMAYDELLRLTDPKLVKLELDCGWVATAGISPASIIKRLGNRVVALHLKDNKTAVVTDRTKDMQSVALGTGVIDWKSILLQAQTAGVQHYFVEQEPPYIEPIFDSLKTSAEYLKHINL